GGMARRILVAGAMVSDARLVMADEPTPGLHPEVVQEALGHLKELAKQERAVMLITHDIEAALTIADSIAVFYAGTTVEIAPVEDFVGRGEALRHPYSRALWQALPQNDFISIAGFQPAPGELPSGCLFAPRCPLAQVTCLQSRPPERLLRGGKVRCHYAT
ncbi:MAG: ABC transporter ATP-binding protein, partial [Firmicutes bacterium]|nr:ABC transporter ATP-binding protein [Bacillota bacterium]